MARAKGRYVAIFGIVFLLYIKIYRQVNREAIKIAAHIPKTYRMEPIKGELLR